jgi:hypothetical protein
MLKLSIMSWMLLTVKCLPLSFVCFQAIIKGLVKTKRLTVKKAQEMFETGVKYTKVEHREIRDQLVRR